MHASAKWAGAGVAALALSAASLEACSSKKTANGGLVVSIATDGKIPIDTLKVTIRQVDARDAGLNNQVVRTCQVSSECPLPTTVGVISNGDPTASVVVTAIAYDKNGVVLDTRTNTVTSVPVDRAANLVIVLSASCAAQANPDGTSKCAEGTTCDPATGGCRSATQSASGLPEYAPGSEYDVGTATTDTGTADTTDSAAVDGDSTALDTSDSANDTNDSAMEAAGDVGDATDTIGDSADASSTDSGGGTTFTARIDGSQIINFTAGTAGTASTATGKAVCVLNAAETALDCTVTHTVTGATVLQLREAFGGLNGTSVLAFDAATSPQTKSFTVTSGLVTSLKTGKLYAHIDSSTTTFPAGEVRGQLLKPGQKLYTATPLKGSNQVPGVASSVTGGVGCVVDGAVVTCSGGGRNFAADSDAPSAAHIHNGNKSTTGGVVVGFTLGTVVSDVVTISGTATVGTELDAAKWAAATTFDASEFYVNLHTTKFTSGAARSQLVLRMTAPAP